MTKRKLFFLIFIPLTFFLYLNFSLALAVVAYEGNSASEIIPFLLFHIILSLVFFIPTTIIFALINRFLISRNITSKILLGISTIIIIGFIIAMGIATTMGAGFVALGILVAIPIVFGLIFTFFFPYMLFRISHWDNSFKRLMAILGIFIFTICIDVASGSYYFGGNNYLYTYKNAVMRSKVEEASKKHKNVFIPTIMPSHVGTEISDYFSESGFNIAKSCPENTKLDYQSRHTFNMNYSFNSTKGYDTALYEYKSYLEGKGNQWTHQKLIKIKQYDAYLVFPLAVDGSGNTIYVNMSTYPNSEILIYADLQCFDTNVSNTDLVVQKANDEIVAVLGSLDFDLINIEIQKIQTSLAK